jgi:hypothetical protein
MRTLRPLLCEYSIGSDRERHLVRTALHPNRLVSNRARVTLVQPIQAPIVTIPPADPWYVSDQATGVSTLNNGASVNRSVLRGTPVLHD